MDIYILDADFETVDIVDDYEYLVWDTAFYKKGFFEMKLPLARLDSIMRGRYVFRSDSVYTGRIDTYSVDGFMISASGRFLEGLLDFRVDTLGREYSGNVETAMFNLLHDNLQGERAIPRLALGTDGARGGHGKFTAFGRGLAGYFYELAEMYDLSFNIRLDHIARTMTFNVIEGLDRTQAQTVNDWSIFSSDFGNIMSEFYETNTDYANVAKIYGQNRTSPGKIALPRHSVTVDISRGAERREIYVDAGDISQEEGMSDDAYLALIRQRGFERLAEAGRFETVDVVVDNETDMPFGLGDICTYKHTITGNIYDLRVAEIKETHESAGVKRNIVFGRRNLGVVEAIKRGD